MTTVALTLQVVRLKIGLWRLYADRALTRLVRRAVDWLAPPAV